MAGQIAGCKTKSHPLYPAGEINMSADLFHIICPFFLICDKMPRMQIKFSDDAYRLKQTFMVYITFCGVPFKYSFTFSNTVTARFTIASWLQRQCGEWTMVLGAEKRG